MKKHVFKMGVASVGLLGAMTVSAFVANDVHVFADEAATTDVTKPATKEESDKQYLENLKSDLEEFTEYLTQAKADLAKAEKDSQEAKDLASDIEEYEAQIKHTKSEIERMEPIVTRQGYKAARAQLEKEIEELNVYLAKLKKAQENTQSDEVALKIAGVEQDILDKKAEIEDINKMLIELGDFETGEAATAELREGIGEANVQEELPSRDPFEVGDANVQEALPEFPEDEVPPMEEETPTEETTTAETTTAAATTEAEALPETGVADGFVVFGAAASAIITGLGLAIPGKKK